MTAWPKIMSAQFGVIHCFITNKTIYLKHNYLYNMRTKPVFNNNNSKIKVFNLTSF